MRFRVRFRKLRESVTRVRPLAAFFLILFLFTHGFSLTQGLSSELGEEDPEKVSTPQRTGVFDPVSEDFSREPEKEEGEEGSISQPDGSFQKKGGKGATLQDLPQVVGIYHLSDELLLPILKFVFEEEGPQGLQVLAGVSKRFHCLVNDLKSLRELNICDEKDLESFNSGAWCKLLENSNSRVGAKLLESFNSGVGNKLEDPGTNLMPLTRYRMVNFISKSPLRNISYTKFGNYFFETTARKTVRLFGEGGDCLGEGGTISIIPFGPEKTYYIVVGNFEIMCSRDSMPVLEKPQSLFSNFVRSAKSLHKLAALISKADLLFHGLRFTPETLGLLGEYAKLSTDQIIAIAKNKGLLFFSGRGRSILRELDSGDYTLSYKPKYLTNTEREPIVGACKGLSPKEIHERAVAIKEIGEKIGIRSSTIFDESYRRTETLYKNLFYDQEYQNVPYLLRLSAKEIKIRGLMIQNYIPRRDEKATGEKAKEIRFLLRLPSPKLKAWFKGVQALGEAFPGDS